MQSRIEISRIFKREASYTGHKAVGLIRLTEKGLDVKSILLFYAHLRPTAQPFKDFQMALAMPFLTQIALQFLWFETKRKGLKDRILTAHLTHLPQDYFPLEPLSITFIVSVPSNLASSISSPLTINSTSPASRIS